MQNIKYITKFLPQRRMFCSESLLCKLKSAVSNEQNQIVKEFEELKDLIDVKAQEVIKELELGCRIKQMNLAEENDSDCLDLELRTIMAVRSERDHFANEMKKFIAFMDEKVNEKAEKLLRELQNQPTDQPTDIKQEHVEMKNLDN